MSVNTEVFDIQPKKTTKEALDLQEERVNFFNSILEMANTAKMTKTTKVKENKVEKVDEEVKPKANKKKPEFTDEHKVKMLENLQKGREKRRANVESKKQVTETKPESKPEAKEEAKPVVKEVVKEVIKEVPIIDPEYEEWKKQKQAKPAPAPASAPIPIPQAPKLNVYSTYKKPVW
jgi:hypothetical protein